MRHRRHSRAVSAFSLRSAWLLLVSVCLAAPWTLGAPTILPYANLWLGGALAAAYALTFARPSARRPPAIAIAAAVPAIFLLACLGWWWAQEEPSFATTFGADYWQRLLRADPLALFQWPRADRLAFLFCVILGFLAAIDLGRREDVRRHLICAIGFSGVAFATYAFGSAWLAFPALPWVLIKDGPEQLNVSFAHYSGPPACLNLAWPLLVFGSTRFHGKTRAATIVLMAAAFPLWPSAAGQTIAVGLLLAGFAWEAGIKKNWLTPTRVGATVLGVIFLVFLAQGLAIHRLNARTPDYWISAQDTLDHAAARDAKITTLASKRGDRLVVSAAPDRPAAWLTAIRMARDAPLFGLGPGAWVRRSALYTHDATVLTFYHYRQYAHHDLLQFAAEWGGLAALAALSLWTGALLNALKRHGENSTADMGVVLALFGIALHSTVDFPLQNPALQIWTAVLLGLAWSRKDQRSTPPSPVTVTA